MAKTVSIAVTLMMIAYGAEALQCYSTTTVDCIPFDSRYTKACDSVKSSSKVRQTCPSSVTSCSEAAVRVKDPGSFAVIVVAGGCESTSFPTNRCYSREQIADVDPNFESEIKDLERQYGNQFVVDDATVCYCNGALCNDGLASLNTAMSWRPPSIAVMITMSFIALLSSIGDA